MSIFQRRVFVMVAMVAVGVMLGLNLASSGIERIQGPAELQNNPPAWTVQQPLDTTEQAEENAAQERVTDKKERAVQQTIVKDGVLDGKHTPQQDASAISNRNEPAVDRLASTTGGVLESVSHKGIEWVVSLFSSITS